MSFPRIYFPFDELCVCEGGRTVYRCPLRPHALDSLGARVTGNVSRPAWMSGPQVRSCVNIRDKQCVPCILCGAWKCEGTPLVVTAAPFLLKELQDRHGSTSASEFRSDKSWRRERLCFAGTLCSGSSQPWRAAAVRG